MSKSALCEAGWRFCISKKITTKTLYRLMCKQNKTKTTPRRGPCESRTICWGGGTSTVIAQFLLQMHNKKMFDLGNECQSDGAQHSEWCRSIANIKLYTSYSTRFYTRSYRFRNSSVSDVWPCKYRSWSPSTIIVVLPFGGRKFTYIKVIARILC